MTYKNCPEYYIKELKERGQWYCKGLGSRLNTLNVRSSGYARKKEKMSKEKIESYKKISQEISTFIEELYSSIPLEKLKEENNPDYPILNEINNLIPKLIEEVKLVFNDSSKYNSKVYNYHVKISRLGLEYRKNLEDLREKIQSYPGYKNWGFKSMDYKGDLWKTIF